MTADQILPPDDIAAAQKRVDAATDEARQLALDALHDRAVEAALWKRPKHKMRRSGTTAEFPINPWTGRPHDPESVRRILDQLKAVHAVCDRYDAGKSSSDAAMSDIKLALGRIAMA